MTSQTTSDLLYCVRIERRINIRSLPDLQLIRHSSSKSGDETQALLKDLLISVTKFFQRPKAFHVIETDVLPAIISRKNNDNKIRYG
jgi:two-component system CheB/CheR fusion protein